MHRRIEGSRMFSLVVSTYIPRSVQAACASQQMFPTTICPSIWHTTYGSASAAHAAMSAVPPIGASLPFCLSSHEYGPVHRRQQKHIYKTFKKSLFSFLIILLKMTIAMLIYMDMVDNFVLTSIHPYTAREIMV